MHLGQNQVDLDKSKTAKLKLGDQLCKVALKRIIVEKLYSLFSETASKAQRKRLACFEVVFAGGVQPSFRLEGVWIMKVIFVVRDGPCAGINLGLAHCVDQHPRLRTVNRLLTPCGTHCPSIVAPGEVRGNPCDPGGYILSPSEITACRYGSCCAEMAVISSPSLYRPRISCCSL